MTHALAAVLSLLALIDRAPAPAEIAAASAPHPPVRVLLAIADDDSVPEWRRNRAVDALGGFPKAEAREWLRVALEADSVATVTPRRLHRVVYALVRGWGATEVERIKPLLKHPDPDVRDTAADALERARRAR